MYTYCKGTYMYVPCDIESELCVWQKFLPGREGGLYNTDLHNTHQRRGGRGRAPMNFIKICINRTFLCVFSTIFMPFSSIFTALFFPYIAHQRTAQILILSVCSSLFFVLSAIAPKMQVRSWAKSRAGRIPLWNRSIALEGTLILWVMALNKNKSHERRANWQNPNCERFAHERFKDKRAP
jgi:hypothetical protein